MAPKVKDALGVMSDAFETACGWALCAVVLYALLFVNMTGNGTLWDSLRGVILDTASAPAPAAVQTRLVPARPVDAMTKAQNRMLLIPDVPEQEFSVPVAAEQQPARAADQITDAPADAKAGKEWRKSLAGSLRTFTVYGEGDQRSSASISAGSAQGAAGASSVRSAVTVTAATPASAYRAGITGEARPGVTDHVTQVDGGTADGVQNFR